MEHSSDQMNNYNQMSATREGSVASKHEQSSTKPNAWIAHNMSVEGVASTTNPNCEKPDELLIETSGMK